MTRHWPRPSRLAAAALGVALVAAATAAPSAAAERAGGETAPTWTHNPASSAGPEHWGGLNPEWTACSSSGQDQSPVVVTSTRPARLPALRVDYPRTPLVVENTGHVVEVPQPVEGGGWLAIGDHRYRLVQWHVHAPSEHVVAGHRADLEIHLVHQDAQGRTAVLAVFADVARQPGSSPSSSAAGLLRATLRAAPVHAGEETDVGRKVTVGALLGNYVRSGAVRDYLTYAGSLTTPPCSAGVRWYLLPQADRVDSGPVQRLHALIAAFPGYHGYPDNNRPVQPLGTRTVERRGN